MIYILEGPDGAGKTTLARAIQDKTKGHILHAVYKGSDDNEMYQVQLIDAAKELDEYQDVVVDRWAPSEFVYGTVYRDGPSFDMERMLERVEGWPVVWIYCRNDNANENHKKNKAERHEMYEDISAVVTGFDTFVNDKMFDIPWITYDFNKDDLDEFVGEICVPRS